MEATERSERYDRLKNQAFTQISLPWSEFQIAAFRNWSHSKIRALWPPKSKSKSSIHQFRKWHGAVATLVSSWFAQTSKVDLFVLTNKILWICFCRSRSSSSEREMDRTQRSSRYDAPRSSRLGSFRKFRMFRLLDFPIFSRKQTGAGYDSTQRDDYDDVQPTQRDRSSR